MASNKETIAKLPINTVIGNEGQFTITGEIGSGSFGVVYLGIQRGDTANYVAIKVEKMGARGSHLKRESNIYKILQGGSGIPLVEWFGQHEGKFNVLAMEMCGPSLKALFKGRKHRFSLKTVLMLMDQLLEILEFVHSKCVLHRDIKPCNLLMGLGQQSRQLHLVDYGISKIFPDSWSTQQNALKTGKSFVGTANYASIHAHEGIELGRRDDLESAGLMMIYFLVGSLPWQKQRGKTQMERFENLAECKLATPVEKLCQGLPNEFATYMDYCRALRYEEEPNYKHLRVLFLRLFRSEGYIYDLMYDWVSSEADGQYFK